MARPRRSRRLKSSGGRKLTLVKLLLLLLVVTTSFYYWSTRLDHWDSQSKVSLVVNGGGEGEVHVITFDPGLRESYDLIIPGTTQVEVSRQLGKRKIGGVWELGFTEGAKGLLLAETITRHFKFPVSLWAEEKALGLVSPSLPSLMKAIFSFYETNLTFRDRLKIALFNLSLNQAARQSVELKDGSYLKKTRLPSGEWGYLKTGKIPQSLAVIFTDSEISRQGVRVLVRDVSGRQSLAEEVAELVEVLGAKVASVTKEGEENSDCQITGTNERIVRKFSLVLQCDSKVVQVNNSFDLEMRLGARFAGRF